MVDLKVTVLVRQQNRFFAVMNNFNRVQAINNDLTEAAGTLARGHITYLTGIEASSNKAKAALQELWNNAISSDEIRNFYELSSVLLKIVDNIGMVNTAIILFVAHKASAVVGMKALGVAASKSVKTFQDLSASYLMANTASKQLTSSQVQQTGVTINLTKAYTGYSTVTKTATASTLGLGTSIKLALASAKPLVLLLGKFALLGAAVVVLTKIGTAISNLARKAKDARKELIEINNTFMEMQSQASLTAFEVETAGKRLEELNRKIQAGTGRASTSLNNDELREFYELNEQVISLMTDSNGLVNVQYNLDETGRKIVSLSDGYEGLIRQLEEFNERQKEQFDSKAPEIFAGLQEEYSDLLDGLVDKQEELNLQMQIQNDFLPQFVEESHRIAQAGEENNAIEAERKKYINENRAAFEQFGSAAISSFLSINNLSQDLIKLFDQEMIIAFASAGDNLESFANALRQMEAIQKGEIFQGIREEIESINEEYDSGLMTASKYNQLMGEQTRKLKSVSVSYKDLLQNLQATGQENSDQAKAYEFLIDLLDTYINNVEQANEATVEGLNIEERRARASQIIEQHAEKVSELESAYNKLASGGRLSAVELNNLASEFPELNALIAEQGELTVDNLAAIEQIAQKHGETSADQIRNIAAIIEAETGLIEIRERLAKVDKNRDFGEWLRLNAEYQTIGEETRNAIDTLNALADKVEKGSGFSGTEGGSTSRALKSITYETDALRDQLIALEKIQKQIEINDQIQSNASAMEKIGLQKQKIKLIEDEKNALHELANAARRQLFGQDSIIDSSGNLLDQGAGGIKQQLEASNVGIKFNTETLEIENYNEIIRKLQDRVNSASNAEQQEALQKEADTIIELMENYESMFDVIEDAKDRWRDSDLNLKSIIKEFETALADFGEELEGIQSQLEDLDSDFELQQLTLAIERAQMGLQPFINELDILKTKLDLLPASDYAGRMEVIAQQFSANERHSQALRSEFDRLAAIVPKNAAEAAALAAQLENLKNEIKESSLQAIEYQKALDNLRIDQLVNSFSNNRKALQRELSLIDHNLKMLQGGLMQGTDISLGASFILPEIPETLYEQQRNENEALLDDQQEYEDTVADMKSDSYDLQEQEQKEHYERARALLVENQTELLAKIAEYQKTQEKLTRQGMEDTNAAVESGMSKVEETTETGIDDIKEVGSQGLADIKTETETSLDNIRTDVVVPKLNQELSAYESHWNSVLIKARQHAKDLAAALGGGGGGNDNSVSAYANGTSSHPGGSAVVGDEFSGAYEMAFLPGGKAVLLGEAGPELVNLPKGTEVLSHDDTKKLLGRKKRRVPAYADGTLTVGELIERGLSAEQIDEVNSAYSSAGPEEAGRLADSFARGDKEEPTEAISGEEMRQGSSNFTADDDRGIDSDTNYTDLTPEDYQVWTEYLNTDEGKRAVGRWEEAGVDYLSPEIIGMAGSGNIQGAVNRASSRAEGSKVRDDDEETSYEGSGGTNSSGSSSIGNTSSDHEAFMESMEKPFVLTEDLAAEFEQYKSDRETVMAGISEDQQAIVDGLARGEDMSALTADVLTRLDEQREKDIQMQFDMREDNLQRQYDNAKAYVGELEDQYLAAIADGNIELAERLAEEYYEAYDIQMGLEENLYDAIQDRYEYQFSQMDELITQHSEFADDLAGQLSVAQAADPSNFTEILSLNNSILGSMKDQRVEINNAISDLLAQRDALEVGSMEWNMVNEQIEEYRDSLADVEASIANQINLIRQVQFQEATRQMDEAMDRVSDRMDRLRDEEALLSKRGKGDLSGNLSGQLSTNEASLTQAAANIEAAREGRAKAIGTEEWNMWNDRLEQAYAQERSLILENADLRRAQLDQAIEESYAKMESNIFNGGTEEDVSEALQAQREEQQKYLVGDEKALTLEMEMAKIQKIRRENESTMTAEKARQLAAMEAQIRSMQSADKLSKEQLETYQKQLRVQEAEMKLQNLKDQKTKRQLTKREDGTWDFEYVADISAIEAAENELRQAKIDLTNWESEQDLKAQEEDLDRRKDFLAQVQDLQNQAAQGELGTEDFKNQMRILAQEYQDIGATTDPALVGELQKYHNNLNQLENEMATSSTQQEQDFSAATIQASLEASRERFRIEQENHAKAMGMIADEMEARIASINSIIARSHEATEEEIKNEAKKTEELIKNENLTAEQKEILDRELDALKGELYEKQTERLDEELENFEGTEEEKEALIKEREELEIKYAELNLERIDEDLKAFINAYAAKKSEVEALNALMSTPITQTHTTIKRVIEAESISGSDSDTAPTTDSPNVYNPQFTPDFPYASAATGMYTGEWGSSKGRFLMAHEKELVLNQSDTRNMLEAVNIVRDLTSVKKSKLSIPSSRNAANQIFQISEVSFPNAVDTKQIQEAILSLPRIAMMKAKIT